MESREMNGNKPTAMNTCLFRVTRHQVSYDRPAGKSCSVGDIEFFHQVRPVHLNGLRADSQSFGNLFGCSTLSYHKEDLPFPLGNLLAEEGLLLVKSRCCMMHSDHLMAANPACNGCKQFFGGKRLGKIVVGSG